MKGQLFRGKLDKEGKNEFFSLQKSSSIVRVGLVHNPAITGTDNQPESLQIARTVEAVLASKSHVTSAMLTFMEKLLDESNNFEELSSDSKAMADLLAKASVCSYNNLFFNKLLLLKSFLSEVVNRQCCC